MAIAFDAASNKTDVAVTTSTIAHTITGSNRLLLVSFLTNNTSDLITGVTYNAIAMTRLKTQASATNGYRSYVYGLLAPATGTNNIVISASGSSLIYSANASYTGVGQGALPTGTAIASNAPVDTSTTWTQDVVTTENNSWIFMHGRLIDGFTITSGTVRADNSPTVGGAGDRGPYATAGTNTINGGMTSCDDATIIAVGFAPSASSGPANLKSYNTNLKANIKSIDTNLIANVKTFDTNA